MSGSSKAGLRVWISLYLLDKATRGQHYEGHTDPSEMVYYGMVLSLDSFLSEL